MMVWKAQYDAVVALYEARLADLRAELERTREDAREASMRARVAELQASPTPPAIVLPPKREPSVVDTAIAVKSMGNQHLRAHLAQFARAQRASGMPEQAIADRILTGDVSSDEEGVDG